MKNSFKSFIIVGILSISFNSYADKAPIKLGEVSKKDVEMTVYDKDPDADAVVLCDYGVLTFDYSVSEGQWKNHLKRVCRIKIFNDDGYKWATEKISLYDDNKVEQSISQIKGYTYNLENGKIQKSKLSKDDIFTEETTKNYKQVKFTLPNVKEGAVIEFSYTVNSNYLTVLDKWQFQNSIPVMWSEYIVSIPEYLTYLMNSQGFEKFETYETNSRARTISWSNTTRNDGMSSTGASISQGKKDYYDNITRWVAKDMPAMKDENFVGNYNNYLMSVDFQLSNYRTFSDVNHPILSDWKNVVTKFLDDYKNFGPNLKKKSFYKDITNKVLAEYQDPVIRTAAVYNFVAQYMKWDKKNRDIPSQNIKKTFEERTGSSADINALLISMLRAVEVDADPVILSTIDNGLVHPVYPIIDRYNYLIARVIIDNKAILLDATEKSMPFGLLPYRCLNQQGYAISETRPGWVNLNPKKGMDKSTMCILSLDAQGLMTGSLSNKTSAYSALSIRNKIDQSGEDKYIENVKSDHADWNIEKLEILAPDEINQPVKENLVLNVNHAAEAMGNMIYINPIISGKIDENPLKQDERKLPIEFVVPMNTSYRLNLTIPEGYIVEELPKSVSIVTPDRTASLKYQIQANGNNLQLVHTWQIKESFYAQDKFHDLKEFYAVLVAKQNEQIVLKKVSVN